jgi:hypothetical protein
MKLSTDDIFVLSIALEQLHNPKGKCPLNEGGIRKLASIQAKMAEHLLPVKAKDIVDGLAELLLKSINYDKQKASQK